MEFITLTTKEQLNIFINPQRQKIIRVMRLSSEPRTPKNLADQIGISPSSIQHHLNKLEKIGLVFIDHTAVIHGITARYYALKTVTVRIGMEHDDGLVDEKEALVKSIVNNVTDSALEALLCPKPDGDILTGVVYLAPNKAKELNQLIIDFVERNQKPAEDMEPWEYAFVYYHAGDKK